MLLVRGADHETPPRHAAIPLRVAEVEKLPFLRESLTRQASYERTLDASRYRVRATAIETS